MKTIINHFNENTNTRRRDFVKKGLIVTLSGIAGVSLLSGCKNEDKSEDKEVSPPED